MPSTYRHGKRRNIIISKAIVHVPTLKKDTISLTTKTIKGIYTGMGTGNVFFQQNSFFQTSETIFSIFFVRLCSFVFIDAVVEPAPSRHFFGELKEEDLDAIENLLSASPEPMTRTVVSHYPFNSIHSGQSSAGRSLSEILDHYRVVSLLSGHLHRVGLFAPLYGRHEYVAINIKVGFIPHRSILLL